MPAIKRFQVQFLGEIYQSELALAAWLKDRSVPAEASALLTQKLMEEHALRHYLVRDLARRRKISVDEFIALIMDGTADHLSGSEILEVRKVDIANAQKKEPVKTPLPCTEPNYQALCEFIQRIAKGKVRDTDVALVSGIVGADEKELGILVEN